MPKKEQKTPKSSQSKATKQQKKQKRTAFYDESRPLHRAMPYILILSGVAFGICLAMDLLGTKGGWLGHFLAHGIGGLISFGVYLLPIIMILHGIYWKKDLRDRRVFTRALFSLLGLLTVSCLVQALTMPLEGMVFTPAEFLRSGQNLVGGGLFGGMLAYGLYRLVGEVCFFIVLFALLGIYALSFVDFRKWKDRKQEKKEAMPKKERMSLKARIRLLKETRMAKDGYYGEEKESFASIRRQYEKTQRNARPVAVAAGAENTAIVTETVTTRTPVKETAVTHKVSRHRFFFDDDSGTSVPVAQKDSAPVREVAPAPAEAPVSVPEASQKEAVPPIKMPEAQSEERQPLFTPKVEEVKPARAGLFNRGGAKPQKYQYPPLDLLADGEGQVMDEETKAEIEKNSSILIDTLESFRVGTHIVGISRGPRITRYEILPNDGVSISSISSHAKDISLRLASGNIRIQAPIPGVAAVGVEVPNRFPAIVRLKDLLVSETFNNAKSKTTVCLGSDVTGKPVFGDIAKMCHLLIAGATGMGKSVCMNAILVSLLYKAKPDEVKLILIDPKKVELNVYNNIPHLLVPVVYEAQAAAGALLWAVGEMERRFELIEAVGVRDIAGYNQAVTEDPEKGTPLPKIIIVIDELNDLMMQARDSVEASICRIAQKARAAGMHLIIGTQRPSVNVITGVIKANIPSRIAFHVSSNVDSRTILDLGGAEKLLANGDMLVNMPGFPEPERVQGAFVHEKEVDAVCKFLQANAAGGSVYDEAVMEGIRHETEKYQQSTMKRGSSSMDDDDMPDDDIWGDYKFCQIVELAIREGKISTSLIQRELSLGYGRAARYIDIMCKMGIVSEPNGPKPRDTLIDYAQYEEMRARSS